MYCDMDNFGHSKVLPWVKTEGLLVFCLEYDTISRKQLHLSLCGGYKGLEPVGPFGWYKSKWKMLYSLQSP